MWYAVGGTMNDKNLEQRLSIKLCVKSSEMLAVQILAYGEYAVKKSNVSERH
jgi:hypothetical protein